MIGIVDAPAPLDEYAPTPIDVFLQRQQTLTPVDRFAAHHDAAHHDAARHGAVRHGGTTADPKARWQERIPAAAPGVGQQYGFEVDLDACTGCKACVSACHSLNGLDDGESWRRVGTLHSTGGASRGTGPASAAIQTVTHACHHCVDPACLNGCPANAYEKDPVTGIVRHLDDDCIGCSYCTLTCPYEVPVYNSSIGIVRKCDMCTDRLAEGEAPACVQGCPQGAITIALVDVAELVAEAESDRSAVLVPGAPESRLTVPTTRYRSSVPLDQALVAADSRSVIPGEGHRPLAVMLVLTQAAVGMLAVAGWLRATSQNGSVGTPLATIGLLTGLAALSASVLHLGRPLLAWRAVLGFRRSWLSREIVAFGVFACAAVLDTALVQMGAPRPLSLISLSVALLAGLIGVACSAQLYAVTGRAWWRWRLTGTRFVATMVIGGSLGTATVLELTRPGEHIAAAAALVVAAAFAAAVTISVPAVALRCSAELSATAYLMRGPLRDRVTGRLALAILGTVLVPAMALAIASEGTGSRQPGVLLGLAWVLAVLGEYHERRLFFLASVGPRLPGQLR